MADKENYRVAIDIFCCHLGMSFDEACAELGLSDDGNQKINNLIQVPPSLICFLPENTK